MKRTASAAFINSVTDKTQGGSTLTQQYVKNVLIEQAVRDEDKLAEDAARIDTIDRKLREAKLAVSLEQKMSKLEILEGYLNIAQFGASVYGVESASQFYFNKPASKLVPVEAALIAGITKAPNTFDPTRKENLRFSTARRNIVLDQMYQQGYITKAEHGTARKTKVEDTLSVNPAKNSCEAAGNAGYFCDYVTKVIESDPVFGKTKEERTDLLMRGGLVIHTTLDSKMQKAANAELRTTLPAKDPTGIATALVSVKPGSGHILAMAQNRKFVANGEKAKKGQTTINYSTDQAHGGSQEFSSGSTYKAFVLAEWLRSGRALTTKVDATGQERTGDDFTARCTGKFVGVYNPGNSDGVGSGQKTVLEATANSINTAYVSMLSQLDLCDVADTAEQIGFRPSSSAEDGVPFIGPSMVLGPQNTSPLAMASAYATFASGGTYCDPVAITKITGPDGAELDLPKANCRAAINAATANGVTYALGKVLTDGGAKSSQLAGGRVAAGKTGTSQSNKHTWFVGYTPQLATSVWIGHPDRDVPMQNITMNGRSYSRVYGSTLAAPTWKRYMDRALKKVSKKGFPDVSTKILEGKKGEIPRLWGSSVSDAEEALTKAGFSVTVRPGQVYSSAARGTVAYTYPAGTAPTGTMVTIYVSNGSPRPVQRPVPRPNTSDKKPESTPETTPDKNKDKNKDKGGSKKPKRSINKRD